MHPLKERLKSKRGAAFLVSIAAMTITFVIGASYIQYSTGSMVRVQRELRGTVAFSIAEAGIEKAVWYIKNVAPDGTSDSTWRTSGRTESFSTGSYTVKVEDGTGANAGKLIITSTGTYQGVARTPEIIIRTVRKNVGVWNNAIFAGVGQAGKGINGNVDIRGSVHILGDGENFSDLNANGVWDNAESYTDSNGNGAYDPSEPFTDTDGNFVWTAAEPYIDSNANGSYDPPLIATDISSSFAGTAYIGNNYSGMPALIQSKVPALGPPDNFKMWNGEDIYTLNTEVRVKHGKVNISGSATIGSPDATGNTDKETVDGMYVNDGYGGNKGAASVYSDNGTGEKYDLGDRIKFPSLYDPFTDPVTGIYYSTYREYLIDKSYTVAVPKIDETVPNFTYIDPLNAANNISWVQATRTLTVNGIIRINGNLDIASKNAGVNYTGTGSFFSEGDIKVHGNFLPVNTFPTGDAAGLIARGKMELATGAGESQLYMAGAFYAEQKVVSAKQNQIAGTFVSSYFDMGTNVPNIYQVPSLADHLPPGMPGKDPIWVVRIYDDSWREK